MYDGLRICLNKLRFKMWPVLYNEKLMSNHIRSDIEGQRMDIVLSRHDG